MSTLCPTCGQPVQGIEARLLEAIRRALDESAYTQKWLAEQVGVTQKHVSMVLNGRTSLNLALAEAMLATLGQVATVEIREQP